MLVPTVVSIGHVQRTSVHIEPTAQARIHQKSLLIVISSHIYAIIVFFSIFQSFINRNIIHLTMKLSVATFLTLISAVSASVKSLTPDNFDTETAGKSVFIKFFAPWVRFCLYWSFSYSIFIYISIHVHKLTNSYHP